MTSSWRGAAGLAGMQALLAAACGGSVHDLTVSSQPLVVLRGHVDRAALSRVHPEAALLAALVWAAVPGVNPVCIELADQRLQPDDPTLAQQVADACPDPFGVFTGQIEVTVPLGADGNFDLRLDHLPMVSVSVGDSATRIAYGSLVVVEDVDGDGQISPLLLPADEERRRPPDQPADPDRIVAATFSDLHADQQRVVFREGGFVQGSYFYPAPGCADTPPAGFSVMTAPPYVDPPPPGARCSFASTDARLEVPPLSRAAGQAFLCRAAQSDATVRQTVSDEQPRGRPTPVCFGHNLVAEVYQPGICPVMRSYALAGCQQDPLCATPEWNITPSLITWWPCP